MTTEPGCICSDIQTHDAKGIKTTHGKAVFFQVEACPIHGFSVFKKNETPEEVCIL